MSNLGMYGVDEFLAIIDPDQAAILTTGQMADQVVVMDGGIRNVPQIKMNLTVDHRVVDGVAAARFLSTIARAQESGEV